MIFTEERDDISNVDTDNNGSISLEEWIADADDYRFQRGIYTPEVIISENISKEERERQAGWLAIQFAKDSKTPVYYVTTKGLTIDLRAANFYVAGFGYVMHSDYVALMGLSSPFAGK